MAWKLPIFAACVLAASTAPARAHHSFSMFDRDKTVTVSGTVKSFDWVNPHAWIQLAVGAEEQADVWSLEMGGPGQLQRQGWTPGTLKMGDKVTVRIHPLRDGSYGGQFVSLTLPDGKILGRR
jgi:hypothetical protein